MKNYVLEGARRSFLLANYVFSSPITKISGFDHKHRTKGGAWHEPGLEAKLVILFYLLIRRVSKSYSYGNT